MKQLFLLLLVCVGVTFAEETSGEYSEVAAPVGRIRGTILTSRLGRKIYGFRGVRYAEPPVGVQRFQVAIPIADWKDVFDGTHEGPACPNFGGAEEEMSEDCLRLNVYTTKLPSENEEVKRPVLVFIHPGAFYGLSAQSSILGPEYLMDEDIVLVTMNYRLAMLGFISTGDSLAPGNLGLKDQVFALRWVQRNIAAFGGDPDSVTLGGYSVGGWSVMLHMISPMSKGLFHRAIAMSGSLTNLEPLPTDQKHLAKKQAELLDCPTDTTGSMLICLNSKPVQNFTNTISSFFEYYEDPIIIWKPVVEPEVHGIERFIPAEPIELLKQGKFHQVPLITGITKDEFGGILVQYDRHLRRGDKSLLTNLNERWDELAPISFIYERGTPRSTNISQELRNFYFGEGPIDSSNYEGIAHIYADSLVIFPVHRTAVVVAENSKEPVYFYKFDYAGRYSQVKWNETANYGVVHDDDLQYLFSMRIFFPMLEKDAPEVPIVEKCTSMWANFVQTGEPIRRDNELLANVTWDRFVPEKDNYLDIDLEFTMKTGIYPDRMAIWEKLFPVNLPVNSTDASKH